MTSRIKHITVGHDWKYMRGIMSAALKQAGATFSSATLSAPISEWIQEDTQRYENGLGPKPSDPLEVRLAKAEKCMAQGKLLQEGKKAEGACCSAAGHGSNWSVVINCYERITYCDVYLVAVCPLNGYAPGESMQSQPDYFGSNSDLEASLRKIDEISNYLITGKSTVKSTSPSQQTSSSSGGGCYIATAVYGSYNCPQVWTLRRFRDDCLSKTVFGRGFIRSYYAISPKLVRHFGDSKWFILPWRNALDIMATSLSKRGFDNTPYQDKDIL